MEELTMFWKKKKKSEIPEVPQFVIKMAQDRYLRWKCNEIRVAADDLDSLIKSIDEAMTHLEEKMDNLNKDIPEPPE